MIESVAIQESGSSDSTRQLKKLKSRIRGGDPRDATGQQMVPMAGMLADEQAMKDVIAYIGTLSTK